MMKNKRYFTSFRGPALFVHFTSCECVGEKNVYTFECYIHSIAYYIMTQQHGF